MRFIVGALLVCALNIFPVYAHDVTANVEDISNRAYFPAILNSVNEAKDSISIAMYAAFFPEYGESHTRELMTAIVNAHRRGVEVTVFLNYDNRAAYEFLRTNDIAVYLIDKKIKLHSKLVVIDNRYTMIGSSNFTDNAFDSNIESNVMIDSKEFAATYAPFFTELSTHTTAIKEKPFKAVNIPAAFLLQVDLGPRMVADSDVRPFQLYLLLLKSQDKQSITLDYVKIGNELGIPVNKSGSYRQQIRIFVEKLKTKYNLIDYTLNKRNEPVVTLKLNREEKVFPLNSHYFDYGYMKSLILREQFAYLVAAYEQSLTDKRYWQMGQEELAKKYHIDNVLFSYAFRELKKRDLIERVPGRADDGKYVGRPFNKYRVKPLMSQAMRDARMNSLKRRWGADTVAKATELAVTFDAANDPVVIKTLCGYIERYSVKVVEEAVTRISKYGDENPLKNLGYLEGIIKNIIAGT